MIRNDKFIILVGYIINNYDIKIFNPQNDFEKKMLWDIIRFESKEYINHDIRDIEIEFITNSVKNKLGFNNV
jgi:hypothetical protein